MKEPIDGYCRMCLRPDKVRNINLYTNGSEGTDLCHSCEMKVVEFIRFNGREAVVQKITLLRKEKANGQ
jgi:hypothetical protein